MKKGFTIIEILAVLTIMAVVTVIAVPVILDVIDNSKIETKNNKAKLFIKSVENKIVQNQVDNISIVNGIYKFNLDNSKICIQNTNTCLEDLELDSNKPDSLEIEITDYEINYYKLEYDGLYIEQGTKNGA